MRPSEFDQWSQREKLSAMALVRYEEDLGPCGQLHSVSTGDMEGWYEVREDVTCWACAARGEYLAQKEKSGANPQPGTFIRIVNTKEETER